MKHTTASSRPGPTEAATESRPRSARRCWNHYRPLVVGLLGLGVTIGGCWTACEWERGRWRPQGRDRGVAGMFGVVAWSPTTVSELCGTPVTTLDGWYRQAWSHEEWVMTPGADRPADAIFWLNATSPDLSRSCTGRYVATVTMGRGEGPEIGSLWGQGFNGYIRVENPRMLERQALPPARPGYMALLPGQCVARPMRGRPGDILDRYVVDLPAGRRVTVWWRVVSPASTLDVLRPSIELAGSNSPIPLVEDESFVVPETGRYVVSVALWRSVPADLYSIEVLWNYKGSWGSGDCVFRPRSSPSDQATEPQP